MRRLYPEHSLRDQPVSLPGIIEEVLNGYYEDHTLVLVPTIATRAEVNKPFRLMFSTSSSLLVPELRHAILPETNCERKRCELYGELWAVDMTRREKIEVVQMTLPISIKLGHETQEIITLLTTLE